MKKMKQACQQSGLTEKAIRLYIQQGLITPQTEIGLYRNFYCFSEADIARLKDIATLREAGFSMADIRKMQQHPEQLPSMLEEKRALLAEDIFQKQALQEILNRLSVAEQGNLELLAEALRPVGRGHNSEQTRAPKRLLHVMILAGILGLLLWVVYLKYGSFSLLLLGLFFSLACSVLCGAMAYRYATCTRRAKKLPEQGVGHVVSVVMDNGFEVSFARAGAAGAGTREPGIGGVWQIVMMFWNEIRPDCWYPVIQYQLSDGRNTAGTFCYGGLEHTWYEGEEVEIAWRSANPEQVFPREAPWLRRKAAAYMGCSLALLVIFAGLLIFLKMRFLKI